MDKATQKILDEIEADQKRIAALTEEGLQRAYEKMKKAGFRTEDSIKFGYDIGNSRWVEYHYHVLCLDWDTDEYARFDDWFSHHLEEGYACLLAKIQDPAYQKYRSQTLRLLANVLGGSYGDDAPKEPYKQAVRAMAAADLSAGNAAVRENAALCLNSIGTLEDIAPLCRVLLSDPNSKCRAWAASALVHIAFYTEEDKIKAAEESETTLKEALEREEDIGALASIIDTVQFLFSKRYKAGYVTGENEGDKEKVLEARQKALRFLNRRQASPLKNR